MPARAHPAAMASNPGTRRGTWAVPEGTTAAGAGAVERETGGWVVGTGVPVADVRNDVCRTAPVTGGVVSTGVAATEATTVVRVAGRGTRFTETVCVSLNRGVTVWE